MSHEPPHSKFFLSTFFGRLLYISLILPFFFVPSSQSPGIFDRLKPPKMSKPIIVLVPGAWHQPAHYKSLVTALQESKFEVCTKKLPSVGSQKPFEQSVANDASFIETELLLPLANAGKDIILLMHSYGGCPGADAAKGLSKSERKAAGKQGGIVGLIFMCAFVAAEGDSLKSKLPGQVYDPWVIENVSELQSSIQ